jgi:oxygen-independent coproporphyrinogen-3 oxidase
LVIHSNTDCWVRIVIPEFSGEAGVWEYQDYDIEDSRYQPTDRQQRCKELVRLGIIRLLGDYFKQRPSWGILSGVRPTRIFRYFRDRGFSIPELREKLSVIYGLDDAKADLLVDVGKLQEGYFKPRNYISIYAGIPFCPTRCHYCSFPAVSLETHGHWVHDYLQSLLLEIRMVSELCQQLNLTVETIYLGGGTPTCLNDDNFAMLLDALQVFRSDATTEFTVEAGRPETISAAKIGLMARAGVSRVSVNPQTMNETTLKRIGRNHSVSQIFEAVRFVRDYSDFSLNMDLILGLPGEGRPIFEDSLTKVMALEPENITIHTLAPKRASAWHREFTSLELAGEGELTETAWEAYSKLNRQGYAPYYLYRQRSILAGLENIGFAKLDQYCIYNIQMMEERQTILGVGAGSMTKWVTGPDFRIIREQNPGCPATYSRLISDLSVKKAQQTRLLLG